MQGKWGVSECHFVIPAEAGIHVFHHEAGNPMKGCQNLLIIKHNSSKNLPPMGQAYHFNSAMRGRNRCPPFFSKPQTSVQTEKKSRSGLNIDSRSGLGYIHIRWDTFTPPFTKSYMVTIF